MRQAIFALTAVTALTACVPGKPLNNPAPPVEVQRAITNAFADRAFDTGPVTVLAEEGGELRSYTLTQCGVDVCAGNRRALAYITADYIIIDGLYAGRTFYLSRGGDGWMKKNGALTPIAWDDPKRGSRVGPTQYTPRGFWDRTWERF